MFERIYRLVLKLYPEEFRRAHGEEALRLVRDRVRDERGFVAGLRLALDLLTDLAISLPREYSHSGTTRAAVAQPVSGNPSLQPLTFQLLAEPSVSPVLLLLAGMLSAVLLWACVSSVARSRMFPALFQDPRSLQALVQRNLDLARASPSSAYNFCITARIGISKNSAQPLLAFDFAPPGASGAALIDGTPVKVFTNQKHFVVRADLAVGNHQFELNLDQPARNTAMTMSDSLQYCAPQ